MSSRSSPLSRRLRNSPVLAWSAASLRLSISGSSALMSGTRACSALSFLPSPERRILSKMLMRGPSLPTTPRRSGSGSVDVEELLAHGVHDGLHAGVQVQLLEDVPHVVLHGVLGDVELTGDLPVAHPLSHELQHLELATREPRGGDGLALVRLLGQVRELREELRRHGGRDEALAADDAADGAGDLLDGDLLQEVARGPRLDGVVEVVLLVA